MKRFVLIATFGLIPVLTGVGGCSSGVPRGEMLPDTREDEPYGYENLTESQKKSIENATPSVNY